MEPSTGHPRPPPPPIQPNVEKIKRKLLRQGVIPTPKILHPVRKKELQKLNRRAAKVASKQPLPSLTESQKQALSEESHFQTVKSEYKSFTNAINSEKRMVGRPWERLERFKLRELASENKECGGGKLKTEHLRELSDIMESEREKLQWLLDDDVEEENGLLQNETSTWTPPKQSEPEAIRIFLDRFSGIEPSVKNWKFSRIMKLSGLQFTERQMLTIVGRLGERGKWRHALSLVEWIYNSKEHGQYKSRFVYTKLLAILGTARRPDEVLRIFNFMRRDAHIYPDMPAYHSAAVALGQAGLLKELLKIIESMKEKPKKIKNLRRKDWDPELQPDVVIFNAVLNACVASRQWKGVSWVFEQMRKNGLRPNGATYGLSMEVMMESGKYDLVHEFFGKMKRSGENLNALTYKVLVQAFWREGKVSEAIQAVRDMEDRGIVGVACVYYELARCLCFHGRCQEAILEVEKIKIIHRTRPLEVSFTGMILAAMDGGDIHGCLVLFEHCKNFCSPDIGIINAMLKVYGRNDMFLEAKELFEVINRDKPGCGILPNDWESSLRPDIYTFSIMLVASASALQWEYFEYVYKDMTLCGYQLDQTKHASLLVEASRAGKWHLLEHSFDTILEAGEIPHPSFFMEMLCQAVIQHDHEGAVRIINTVAHAPFQISELQWIELFEQNGERISRASLKQLSDSLRTHHLATEATILNISRALESVCGTFSSRYSLPAEVVDGSSQGNGSTNICDAPAHMAAAGSSKSLEVDSNDDTSSIDCSHQVNDHREEQTRREHLSLLPIRNGNGYGYGNGSLHEMDEHSDPSFASSDTAAATYWASNSSDSEDDDLEVDVDELNLDVSKDGESDWDSLGSNNTPSADEILNTWKKMRQKDGNFFSFPLRSR